MKEIKRLIDVIVFIVKDLISCFKKNNEDEYDDNNDDENENDNDNENNK